jgi:hypothetical protein
VLGQAVVGRSWCVFASAPSILLRYRLFPNSFPILTLSLQARSRTRPRPPSRSPLGLAAMAPPDLCVGAHARFHDNTLITRSCVYRLHRRWNRTYPCRRKPKRYLSLSLSPSSFSASFLSRCSVQRSERRRCALDRERSVLHRLRRSSGVRFSSFSSPFLFLPLLLPRSCLLFVFLVAVDLLPGAVTERHPPVRRLLAKQAKDDGSGRLSFVFPLFFVLLRALTSLSSSLLTPIAAPPSRSPCNTLPLRFS